MDRISICEFSAWRAAGRAFTLLDVRRDKVRRADGEDVPGAVWRDPEQLFTWKDQVPRDRPVIILCAHGHELSQGAAATLRSMGLDARYLIDGFSGWKQAGQPVQSIAGPGAAA